MYIKDDPYASYKLLAEEFKKRGYTVSEEKVGGIMVVTYTSPSGKIWKTQAAHISYPFSTQEMRLLSRNKEVAYTFAEENGVTTPFTLHLRSGERIDRPTAESLFEKYTTLIVKPSDASLARGLTLDIHVYDDLKRALGRARKVSASVLIQEQVEGEEIRFAVLDGKVVAALLRRTARVTGDGKSTVAQLIKHENQERKKLALDYITYPQLTDDTIDGALLGDQTIPIDGEVVPLNRATMIKNGCSVYDVLNDVHPSYIKKIEALSAHLSTKFVVVDLFIKDFEQPLAESDYWFIEFNTSPVLKLFYGCRDGKMFDVVPVLVECIDKYLHTDTSTQRQTLGGFEPVSFPDLGKEIVTAKVDTGAYSGALFATHVRQKKDEKGRRYLQFAPFGDKANLQTSYDYYRRHVRSAHGHVHGRFVVTLRLKLKGTIYKTDIGLSDRSDMKHPVLIGRKFLREHKMLVDVILNEELDYEKEILG